MGGKECRIEPWRAGSGLIMACYAGSHLYGLNRPDSDIDIRGVCFPPIEALLGMTGFEQYQPGKSEAVKYSQEQFDIGADDVTVYALSKFFKLCLDANPNIIELLFAPLNAVLYTTGAWEQIMVERQLFLSTKAVHTFSGYAYQQLHKIKGHKRWLDTAPEKPEPMEYGLSPKRGGGWKWTDKDKHDAYFGKTKEWEAYESWRKNRNPERAKLENKYGFDVKHGMHLYRLFFEGEELLRMGKITLPLVKEIRERLLAVLHGEISYEDIVDTGEKIKNTLLAVEQISPLPHNPDRKGAEKLLIELQKQWLLIRE